MIHHFTDHPIRMSHELEAGKIHVFFRREAALLWVRPAAIERVEVIADAVEAGGAIDVDWDPNTLEIVGARQGT